MGAVLCIACGAAGKTSPLCPFPSRYPCPFARLGKWMYEKNLSCYESACQEVLELKSFDSALHRRTSKYFTSLARPAGKNENPSLHSLIQVCRFLKDLGEDVVNIYIGYHEGVWKNEELNSLIDLYFKGTSKTLNLFSNFVKKAQNILPDLHLAIKKYETESVFGGSMPNKYAETLEQLNKVTNMEDPFGDDFAKQYESVLKEHAMILEKIEELQVKLDEKHKNVEKQRLLVNALFVTMLISLVALSVASFVVATPPAFVGISVKVLSTSIGPAGAWVNRIMCSDEALKKHIESLQSTEKHTEVNFKSMEKIKGVAKTLQSQIKSISQTVEVSVQNREEEEAMKLVMQKFSKEVKEFAEQIDSVGEEVASCSKSVAEGKESVIKCMTRF